MNHPKLTIVWKVIGRKLAVMLLLGVSAAGAFATLGDGKKKSGSSTAALLSYKANTRPGSFSLRSGYLYRGNEVINTEKKYIRLNTTVTMQRGSTTYIVPLKKKVLLSNVKIDLGNRQLKRN